jgi:hypothetical protein
VSLGEAGEGAVRLVADEVEAADEWQRERSWREAAARVGEEVQEVDGEEGGDEPWQPRKKLSHRIWYTTAVERGFSTNL